MNQIKNQNHVAELINFFNQLYGKITAPHFAYLWTKQLGIFSFQINEESQRMAMAIKAVELSDCGVDVWHSVNTVCVRPTNGKRGDETVVSYQIACVVDIDICSDAHKSDNLANSFEEAKSFLPFTPSLIIHSGYGLHAYYIFDTPIEITDENREQLKHRNILVLDVIRAKAKGKKIDGVGDLPRVLRTPGTFNYKLDTDNPPLCHIVENSGLLFSPTELDEKLGAIILAETKKAQPTTTTTTKSEQTFNEDFVDDRDFNVFRVRRMLDFIPPSSLTYDEWLGVGMALKNTGCDCSDWENWSRADERFKDGECEYKWNGFNRDGYDIGTLYHLAELNGYDAKEIYYEWKTLQRTFRSARIRFNGHTLATEGSLHSIYSTPERSDFSMGNDNKVSPQNQPVNDLPPFTPPTPVKGRKCDSDADNIVLPTLELPPYTKKDGIEFYSATQVARILHVTRPTVLYWRKKGLFVEDFIKHNVFLYSRERVEQLKSVYHKEWTWGGYMPSPTTSEVPNEDQTEDSTSQIDSLKTELHEVNKAIANLDKEKDAALKLIRDVESFDSDTVFAEKVIKAAAFARLFDKKAFSDFRGAITSRNRNAKDKKVSVTDWLAEIRDKATEISSRQNDLLTRRNEIQAQIRSLSFIANVDDLQNFSIPSGYSVSENGIEKVAGETMISVCRRSVIIKAKTFSVDEKIYKLILAYMKTTGEMESLPATEAAIIFNRNKLVDLANNGLPVTSSNATLLVDYLDAFNADNENNFPMTYTVSRCGWYHFNGTDHFIDPRRNCVITNKEKNISVVVDSTSQFAQSLRQIGSLKNWKRAYELAKKSPVARIIVAATIAPILLKILGERNFLLHIYAPTRAGKTTALYLGASAIGSEKIIRSFDATRNGLAGVATDVSDYAFLVDEKQVADSKLKEQFDTLVYSLANGIGRTKLNKDSTVKKIQDWRTIVIMTGETLLLPDNVTGGANTRLLTIAAPKVILPADICKEIRTIIKENYGLVFPLVINKVFELDFDNLRKWYTEIVDAFTAAYPELLPDYCRYMAILTLADALLNFTLGEDFNTVLQDAKSNAMQIFPLLPTTTEISDTRREKDFVLAIIAQNQSRFIGGNIPLDRMQTICGKLDDREYVYIAAKFLQDECNRDGYDYRKLVSDLVADGFFTPADAIERGNKSTLYTVQKKIGKANTRCYRIKKAIFDGVE